MLIHFIEPVAPRYIHINTATNKVHLLVPLVGGQEISMDNSAKAMAALQEFFDGGALRELNYYKEELAFDLALLEEGAIERQAKEIRLAQIDAYLDVISAMGTRYNEVMAAFLAKPSNLYRIQLRPREQNSQSTVVNPLFSVNRGNDASSIPLSALYNALHAALPATVVAEALRPELALSPFYSIPVTASVYERTERLSILSQFFLATLNVYCAAKEIGSQNLGILFDASPALSNELVHEISTALTGGEDVEQAICIFCTANSNKFQWIRTLNADDLVAIRHAFVRYYRTLTATTEYPRLDDFMILDKEATGAIAKFVTHQNFICVNLAELIAQAAVSYKPEYFASIRADFTIHPVDIPHRNDSVAGAVDADIEMLNAGVNDAQFARLPTPVQQACRKHPSFQIRRCRPRKVEDRGL